MLTRRQMLERSLLASVTPLVPSFLARTAQAASAERDRRVLVVVQLDGGNDGLNTVVPHRDENYSKLRPKLKLAAEDLIRVTDELSLNAVLKPLAEQLDAGRLCLVQGVGYPNPNRSHFRSMAIWHSARLEESQHSQYGWLGRALDGGVNDSAGPQAVFASADAVPSALWARRAVTAVVRSPEELRLDAPAALLQMEQAPGETSAMAAIQAASHQAFSTCERLAPLLASADLSGSEASHLGQSLKTIAALIKADSPTRVYYAVQGGYDTHAAQRYPHARLLRGLGRELGTFLTGLKADGLDDRVLVLVFSEFGRRAAENGSEGTDHGAAGPVLLAGPSFRQGIVGPAPNLSQLVEGDVPSAIDFRQVYAEVLERWLGINSNAVLAGDFAPLEILG